MSYPPGGPPGLYGAGGQADHGAGQVGHRPPAGAPAGYDAHSRPLPQQGHGQTNVPYGGYPGAAPGTGSRGTLTAFTPSHWAAVAGAGLAFLTFLVSLFLNWVVADGEFAHVEAGIIDVLDGGNGLNKLLAVMYLLFTLTAGGLAAATLFLPQGQRRWFALAAGGAALLDLVALVVLAFRIVGYAGRSADKNIDVTFGVGWYVGLLTAVALCGAAGLLLASLVGEFSRPAGGPSGGLGGGPGGAGGGPAPGPYGQPYPASPPTQRHGAPQAYRTSHPAQPAYPAYQGQPGQPYGTNPQGGPPPHPYGGQPGPQSGPPAS